jgi:hypothetical protein
MITPLRQIIVLVAQSQVQVQLLVRRVQVNLVLAVSAVNDHVQRVHVHQRMVIVVV